MSKILELREKRAKAWDAAKAFLDAKRTQEGFVWDDIAIVPIWNINSQAVHLLVDLDLKLTLII